MACARDRFDAVTTDRETAKAEAVVWRQHHGQTATRQDA
jgi:hypothetical protein